MKNWIKTSNRHYINFDHVVSVGIVQTGDSFSVWAFLLEDESFLLESFDTEDEAENYADNILFQ